MSFRGTEFNLYQQVQASPKWDKEMESARRRCRIKIFFKGWANEEHVCMLV